MYLREYDSIVVRGLGPGSIVLLLPRFGILLTIARPGTAIIGGLIGMLMLALLFVTSMGGRK